MSYHGLWYDKVHFHSRWWTKMKSDIKWKEVMSQRQKLGTSGKTGWDTDNEKSVKIESIYPNL